jgi:hypothetical protein
MRISNVSIFSLVLMAALGGCIPCPAQTCPPGTYSWYFPLFLSISPDGGTYECISNSETPDQWMSNYVSQHPVRTNSPASVIVRKPGDLWLTIDSVQRDQIVAVAGQHVVYGDIVDLTVEGCVSGTWYTIYGASDLRSTNWFDTWVFFATGETNQVEVTPAVSQKYFFRVYGQLEHLASPVLPVKLFIEGFICVGILLSYCSPWRRR